MNKQLEALSECVLNVKDRNNIESKLYAAEMVAYKFLKDHLSLYKDLDCGFPSGYNFLQKTVLKDKTIAYIKLLCKLIHDSEFNNSNFDGTHVRILRANHIPLKSVIVYSRIIQNMIRKDINKPKFTQHFESMTRILQVLYFCSQSFEFYEESKNLPF